MSVILVDLGDDTRDVMISNAGWRDTVALIRPFGVLTEERLQQLETAWLGQQFTQEEARAIGEAIWAGPLAAANWSGNVYPPAGLWADPSNHSREYDPDTYWPAWLRAFAGFCVTCRGFIAY